MTVKIIIKKASNKKVAYNISQLVTSVTWSGSDTQASRKLEFSVLQSVFDPEFPVVPISTGDIAYFYFEDKLKFTGRVTSLSQSAGSSEISYTACDYLNLLLKSNVRYVFKNATAEQIAKKLLRDFGISAGKIAKTRVNIKKWIVDGENAYNVLIGAYYKAHKKTKKKYMPVMDGTKVCVVEKGADCGARLTLDANVTATTLEENAEEIINRVLIFDNKGKKLGEVKDADSIKLFGIYQDIYKKADGANAKSEAAALLKEPTKQASVEALGDIRCVAGKSVKLKDNQTGLLGKFWIENDSHSFSGGEHTMSLTLSFKNVMEGSENTKTNYPIATGDHICYYSSGSSKFHSFKKCGSGLKNPIKSTVNEAVKSGRKKCSRCWK